MNARYDVYHRRHDGSLQQINVHPLRWRHKWLNWPKSHPDRFYVESDLPMPWVRRIIMFKVICRKVDSMRKAYMKCTSKLFYK